MTTQTTITGISCPACSGRKHHRHPKVHGVYTCDRCGAVHGTCYKGESYEIVLPYWHEGESKPEDERYYDLETLGTTIERRHGWFNINTKRITQTG